MIPSLGYLLKCLQLEKKYISSALQMHMTSWLVCLSSWYHNSPVLWLLFLCSAFFFFFLNYVSSQQLAYLPVFCLVGVVLSNTQWALWKIFVELKEHLLRFKRLTGPHPSSSLIKVILALWCHVSELTRRLEQTIVGACMSYKLLDRFGCIICLRFSNSKIIFIAIITYWLFG